MAENQGCLDPNCKLAPSFHLFSGRREYWFCLDDTSQAEICQIYHQHKNREFGPFEMRVRQNSIVKNYVEVGN